MNKSIFDRIFPHPPEDISHGDRARPQRASNGISKPRSSSASIANNLSSTLLNPFASVVSSQQMSNSGSLRHVPLASSALHHDNPLLPVERAAKALEQTIQSLLNAQSAALSGRSHGTAVDTFSNGSVTPTPSSVSPLRGRTIPIRQPPEKKITLRKARRDLRKSMLDFALLRGEEIRLLETESNARIDALEHVEDLENRRVVLTKEIGFIRSDDQFESAKTFRNEATQVGNEIEELEHRILELKVRQRHLTSQAEQIESSLDSRASSYRNTLSLVERDIKGFLKRPPVQGRFPTVSGSDMYVLQPQRRTLQMAKDQWTTEQTFIAQRTADAEEERRALKEGEKIWSNALTRIEKFEAMLRSSTNAMSESASHEMFDTTLDPTNALLQDLNELIQELEQHFNHAQTQNWNLLLCAIGAEIDACLEARNLLTQDAEHLDTMSSHDTKAISPLPEGDEGLTTARQSPQKLSNSPTNSERSSRSLKDTLAEFKTDGPPLLSADQSAQHDSKKPSYESEDDEPPSDFLLSH